jgi:tetratricopeptide (TPR) repeat protein
MKNKLEHVLTPIASSLRNPLQVSTAFGLLMLVWTLLVPARLTQAQTAGHPAESSRMQQIHEAVSLAEHGDPNNAMQIATQLLKQDPQFVPAMKLKGMLLEGAGRGAEAGAEYEEALQLAPNDGDLLLKTGIYKLAMGRREEALTLLLHASRVRPGDGEVQYYLAQAYHLNGHDDLAIAAIRKSLKADPANAAIMQKYGELLCSSGNNQDGLHWLLQAQQANPKLPHIDYEIGAADYKSMDLAGAVENLIRAVEVNPDDVNALQILASAQTKLAQWEAAKESYTSLLTRRQGDAESLLGLGQCELELKDYSNAVSTLQAALRADPTKLLAHFYLSHAYAAMGKTADAQHEAALHRLMMEQMSFVRSVETDQREDTIRLHARQLLKDHNEDAALRLYQENSKGTAATTADAFVFIGKTYLFMGYTEDGVRCIHHALALDPKVRGAHTYIGILDLKMADLAKAEDEFKAELANDSSYQLAIAEMGEVRYHQDKWSEAAEWLAKSKSMTPEFLYMLSDADFHLGNIKDATLVAETAAAYGANNREFMQGLVALLVKNAQVDLARRIAADSHL